MWQVSVSIVDTNEPPYFSGTQLEWKKIIPEGSFNKSTALFLLVAEDDDLPGSANSQIAEYRIITNSTVPFEINSQGYVYQIQPLSLCIQSGYYFIIEAVDGSGLTTVTPFTVNITVSDVNNFTPQLNGSRNFYITELQDDWSYSFAIEDADCGMSGETTCSMSPNNWFTINPTCKLRLVNMLYYGDFNHTFAITVTVKDNGVPSISTDTVLTVHVLPANNHPVHIDLPRTQLQYMEEGDSIEVFQGVSLSDPDKVTNFTVNVTLDHDEMVAEEPPHNCTLQPSCLPDATKLLPTTGYKRLKPVESTVTFTALIKINDVDSYKTLFAVYSLRQPTQENLRFDLRLKEQTLIIRLPRSNQRLRVMNWKIPNIQENTWHQFTLSIVSNTLYVFIDGNVILYEDFKYNFFKQPSQKHLATLQPYYSQDSITIENPLVTFSNTLNIFQVVSCILNDGVSLDFGDLLTLSSQRTSAFQLTIESNNASELSHLLSTVKFVSPDEPSKSHNKITLSVSDGLHTQAMDVVITVASLNDHDATFKLSADQTKDFVLSANTSHVVVAPDTEFCDVDTLQMNYSVIVSFRTVGLDGLCNKIQRTVDIKLRQCGIMSAINLLPPPDWELNWLAEEGVTKFGREINRVGYHFDGLGGVASLYQRTLNFNQLTFTMWILYSEAGYIATIELYVTAQITYTIGLYGTEETIEIHLFNGSNPDTNRNSPDVVFSWPWRPMHNEWLHITVCFHYPAVDMFINGKLQSTNFTLSKRLPKSGTFMLVTTGGRWNSEDNFFDSFSGVVSEFALIPNIIIEQESLRCLLACSEQLSVLPTALPANNSEIKITTHIIDGHLEISGKMTSKEMQTLLRGITYTNVHPYAFSGNRELTFSAHDGHTSLPVQQLTLAVKNNRERTISLLNIDSVIVTRTQLGSGFRPLKSISIKTDNFTTDTIDSSVVDISSLRCHIRQYCQLHLDGDIINNSTLQILTPPGKIILSGIRPISHYEQVLRAIVLRSTTISGLTHINTEVSDYNHLVSSSKQTSITIT